MTTPLGYDVADPVEPPPDSCTLEGCVAVLVLFLAAVIVWLAVGGPRP